MLNISLSISQPYDFYLLRTLCLDLYSIFKWVVFLITSFLSSLYILHIVSLLETSKILFPFWRLSLCTNDAVLCCAEAFHFHEVSLSIFELCACANNVLFGKSFPVPMRSSLFPIFSFNRLRVSSLMLRSLIYLDQVEFCSGWYVWIY